ncbi:hypothetical protein TPHA_0D02010 [Tetrapisispora phaffii CBS 4417]|uniref:Inositol-pentakisphosphate 2-kinase n=1 Tax=Tetrapisispora phaffii (strain ATCC 24235 / CBS 4417 / NBRC 1672 / NRRL Y-8282 / UCD 70-5) TaxID=1071381 RepID=G8BSL8_TETPH|nr:hypothetical protein TPHA_0D02010 [Tetrapisispora phaffii CBS 4417]CCE62839.1 hypothetical protein TPHA_0D02010 [Tetrapisispora phaffii CBS 4417]
MKVIAKGNANIIIDYDDPLYLYRCLVRDSSLKINNLNTVENFKFLQKFKADEDNRLSYYLCTVELLQLQVNEIRDLLEEYITKFDTEVVYVFKLENLKPNYYDSLLWNDHFTRVYFSKEFSNKILIELKPKWIYYQSPYCRNCTHNQLKSRSNINYCYSHLVNNESYFFTNILGDLKHSLPPEFIISMESYMRGPKNIFKLLYETQKSLYVPLGTLNHSSEVDYNLLLLMALRDVTLFIEWDTSKDQHIYINFIDLDRKPSSKLSYWLKTHEKLEMFPDKVYH